MRRPSATCVAAFALVPFLFAAPPARAACPGDCDGNQSVSIAELVRAVSRAVDGEGDDDCDRAGCAGPSCVTIDRLVSAVDNALNGCPDDTPAGVVLVLQQLVGATCQVSGPTASSGVEASGVGYGLYCMPGPGHQTRGVLSRHASAAEAAQAFVRASGDGAPWKFNDLPAAYWEVPFAIPDLGGADRYLVWQLGCWVVTVHSFDDSSDRLAPQPQMLSNALLQTAGERLRAQCS
ncbi:MAG: hypothetical protein SF182_06075 [Deltaproteobacteria bacterium]|nr:hypothetical protein [Deltaproteobacteria bacterium]